MGEKYWAENLVPAGEDAPVSDDENAAEQQNTTGVLKENPTLLFLAVLFLFGLLLGSLFIAKADKNVLDTLDYLFFTNIEARTKDTLFLVFVSSMTSSFLFILMNYLCGLSMWGRMFIPFVLLLRGFGLGLTAGYIYSFGVSGFFYYLLLILPGAFLSILAILFTAVEGTWFSKRLNAFHKAKQHSKGFVPPPSIQNFSLRFAIITLLAILAAAVDVLTALLFSGFFQELF